MKIVVVGTGYVGLTTGTCLAETGNTVWCIDKDEIKIKNLQAGILPIYEPGLKEMVTENVKEGRLHFSTDLKAALEDALFCFITVGTPPGTDGAADLTQVYSVAKEIGKLLDRYLIVVDKSTVPVGTAVKVRELIRLELVERGKEHIDFDVVANPEFLKEGVAVADFMQPDRVIIGTDNVRTAEIIKQLYQPFVRNQHPILVMDIASAELTKYAANAMLAARISFINEIAKLCDKVGADVSNVRQGIGTDSRIGMQFLHAGVGYGGSCFPKDVKELIHTGCRNGVEMEIVKAVERVNEQQKRYLADMIKKYFDEDISGKKFALWGLAFKPQTDDMREAPAIIIIESLIQMGATIVAYDPEATQQAEKIFAEVGTNHLQYALNMMDALNGADALIIATDWRQFRQPDFDEMQRRLRKPLIFDGRNQYDPEWMRRLGFEYYCVGRGCCVG